MMAYLFRILRKWRQIQYLKFNVRFIIKNVTNQFIYWFEFVEILGCSLTTVVLQLLALGVQDPLNFDFMDRPPTEVSLTGNCMWNSIVYVLIKNHRFHSSSKEP